MQIRYSSHGAYHHQDHIVWMPKYRRRVRKGEFKKFIEEHLVEIQNYHPDMEIEKYSIREGHIHLIIIVPRRYSASGIVGKIQTNTSRDIRKKFDWVRGIYDPDEFWSPGFFSSMAGVKEEVIRRHVEFQEKIDKEQMQ